MDVIYPQLVDGRKPTFCGLRKPPQFVNAYRMVTLSPEYEEIGKRLAAIRLALSDLSQKAWAEKHGFSPTQYNNWEKGTRRIPVECAERLSDRYSLTLDAIYRGKLNGLPENIRNVL